MGSKFYVSDLDGTLLDNPKQLSAHYVEQLNDLIAQGLQFTIATGRDMHKTLKALNGVTLKYPAILTNGALLANLALQQYLRITTIPQTQVNQIMKIANNFEIRPIVFAAYDSTQKEMHFNKGKWGQKGIFPLSSDIIESCYGFDVVSIQFHLEKHKLDLMREQIITMFPAPESINIIYIEDVSYKQWGIQEEYYWLEFNSNEAGKEKMLSYFCHQYGIALEDVVAIGDNHNDIEMLKAAGRAIVVNNAPQEVQNIADEIIPSNQEGGVIQFLKREFNNS